MNTNYYLCSDCGKLQEDDLGHFCFDCRKKNLLPLSEPLYFHLLTSDRYIKPFSYPYHDFTDLFHIKVSIFDIKNALSYHNIESSNENVQIFLDNFESINDFLSDELIKKSWDVIDYKIFQLINLQKFKLPIESE